MKILVNALLSALLLLSNATALVAETTISQEVYYTVPVEYSDNIGNKEYLNFMVKDECIYVNAEMIAYRLGYSYLEKGDKLVISSNEYNKNIPFGQKIFSCDSTKVTCTNLFGIFDSYEAPFVSVKNEMGGWIPFDYSLLLLNSGKALVNNVMLIDMPTKRAIDYFYDVSSNLSRFPFEWAKDLGYSDTDLSILGVDSHLINLMNGVLGLDGDSWVGVFTQPFGNFETYDAKFGEKLSILFCAQSDSELKEAITKNDMVINLFSESGELGTILSRTSNAMDRDVGILYNQCLEVLETVKNGNSPLLSYNRSYQALEQALDKQTWFSNTGGNILAVQKNITEATGKAFTLLKVASMILEVSGYSQEFHNQDTYSTDTLLHYFQTADNGLDLPSSMKRSMTEHAEALSSNTIDYMEQRFKDNVDQWILRGIGMSDGFSMSEVLGTQGAAALLAWNLASMTVPFVKNGLEGAENFELAMYSQLMQSDAMLNYLYMKNSYGSKYASGENELEASDVFKLVQFCYVYLKFCLISRESALASLVNKRKSIKDQIQPLIDYQNSINKEISTILVDLKDTDANNTRYNLGFFPADNREFLKEYRSHKEEYDSLLIDWLILNTYCNVKGKIVSGDDKLPLCNVAVKFIGATSLEYSTETNADGFFEMFVKNDEYECIYSVSGWNEFHTSIIVNESMNLNDIVMEPKAMIRDYIDEDPEALNEYIHAYVLNYCHSNFADYQSGYNYDSDQILNWQLDEYNFYVDDDDNIVLCFDEFDLGEKISWKLEITTDLNVSTYENDVDSFEDKANLFNGYWNIGRQSYFIVSFVDNGDILYHDIHYEEDEEGYIISKYIDDSGYVTDRFYIVNNKMVFLSGFKYPFILELICGEQMHNLFPYEDQLYLNNDCILFELQWSPPKNLDDDGDMPCEIFRVDEWFSD